MIKVSIFLTRRPDLTHEEFIEYWTQKHTPLIASLPGDVPIKRYVQLSAIGEQIPGFEAARYDGVAEVWVDQAADAVAWFTSPTYTTIAATDEENFLDRSRTTVLFSTEDQLFG